MQKHIAAEGILRSVPPEAGALLVNKVFSILVNSKNKTLLPSGSYSLPFYEYTRLCGMLLRFKKTESRALLRCMLDANLISCSPQRTEIIFSLKPSEVDNHG